MRGRDVEEAQRRLRGSNVLRTNFAPGSLDGVYGEATMRAAKRAKFWLGYPTKSIDGVYGDLLHAYLGGKALPAANRLRRAARLRAVPATPLREKALANLRSKLGTKESPPGSNRCWATAWYGLVGPWCAMSASWAYSTAGSKSLGRGHYAYVPFIVADARAGRNGLSITKEPKPGDLCCYDWNGDGIADHVGLYEKPLGGDNFSAIEGNTAVGNDSNGGEVMRRERHRSQVQAFVHVSR